MTDFRYKLFGSVILIPNNELKTFWKDVFYSVNWGNIKWTLHLWTLPSRWLQTLLSSDNPAQRLFPSNIASTPLRPCVTWICQQFVKTSQIEKRGRDDEFEFGPVWKLNSSSRPHFNWKAPAKTAFRNRLLETFLSETDPWGGVWGMPPNIGYNSNS